MASCRVGCRTSKMTGGGRNTQPFGRRRSAMKRHMPFALLATLLVAADAPQAGPAGRVIELPEGVTHVALAPGEVQWENVRTKGGMILRVTAGKTAVEGRRLFYGDGKLAVEIAATAEGMHFIQWTGWKAPTRSSGNLDFSVGPGIRIYGEHDEETVA